MIKYGIFKNTIKNNDKSALKKSIFVVNINCKNNETKYQIIKKNK